MAPSSPLPLRRGAGGGAKRSLTTWRGRPSGSGAREARHRSGAEGERRATPREPSRVVFVSLAGGGQRPPPTARQGTKRAAIRTGWRRVRHTVPTLRMRDASAGRRGAAARFLRRGWDRQFERRAIRAARPRQGRTPAGPRPPAGSVHDGPVPKRAVASTAYLRKR